MSALQARNHLVRLQAERLEALAAGLVDNKLYFQDLEQEMSARRRQYVMAAVTEIATLRAELFGAQSG